MTQVEPSQDFDSSQASSFTGNDTIETDEIKLDEEPSINKKQMENKQTTKRLLTGFVIIAASIVAILASGMFSSSVEIPTISTDTSKAANNGELVHAIGPVSSDTFTDPMFKITAEGAYLERIVEMYQWVEKNGEFTKEWQKELVDVSSAEARAKGLANPPEMPFFSEKWQVSEIKIGNFSLSDGLLKQVNNPEQIILTQEDYNKLNEHGQKAFKLYDGKYFFGLDPQDPRVGDLMVSFKSLNPGVVSVLARQTGPSFTEYRTEEGTAIARIMPGEHNVQAIAKGLDLKGSSLISWIIRIVAGLILLFGLNVMIGRTSKTSKEEKQPGITEDDDLDKELAAIQAVEQDIFEKHEAKANADAMTEPDITDISPMEDDSHQFNTHPQEEPQEDNVAEQRKQKIDKKISTPLEFNADFNTEPVESAATEMQHEETAGYHEDDLPAPEFGNEEDEAPSFEEPEEMPENIEILSDDLSHEEENPEASELEVNPEDLPPPPEIPWEGEGTTGEQNDSDESGPFDNNYISEETPPEAPLMDDEETEDDDTLPEGIEIISDEDIMGKTYKENEKEEEIQHEIQHDRPEHEQLGQPPYYPQEKTTEGISEIDAEADETESEDESQHGNDLPEPPAFDESNEESAAQEEVEDEPGAYGVLASEELPGELPQPLEFNTDMEEEETTEENPETEESWHEPDNLPEPLEFDSGTEKQQEEHIHEEEENFTPEDEDEEGEDIDYLPEPSEFEDNTENNGQEENELHTEGKKAAAVPPLPRPPILSGNDGKPAGKKQSAEELLEEARSYIEKIENPEYEDSPFELPDIPDDFDPSVEMPPLPENNEDEDEKDNEDESPFDLADIDDGSNTDSNSGMDDLIDDNEEIEFNADDIEPFETTDFDDIDPFGHEEDDDK